MSSGDAYDEQLRELAARGTRRAEIFWRLAERDIREACDLFRPVLDAGNGRDGYVSLEVDPRLAYDTLATFREAMRLHETVDRPNLMVKIPATKPGLAAIEDVIAKGRSINVTLIFSLRRYAEVAESYVRGLERLVAEGGDPAGSHRWRASSSRGSTPSATSAWRSWVRREAPAGQAGGRQREARLPALQAGLLGSALGVPGLQGGDAAARAVGLDVDQEPGLPGHALRRRADRPGHGQHDARGDDPRLPGPRPPASRAWSGSSTARASSSTSSRGRASTTRTSPRRSSARASRSSRRRSTS